MELTAATTLTALWAVTSYYFWKRDRLSAPPAHARGTAEILLTYASQSGQARNLATQYARQLVAANHALEGRLELRCISQLAPEDLSQYRQVFILASTYGEGQPPDSAQRFSRAITSLADNHFSGDSVQFAVLALGDKKYPHFCAFGHWLHQQLLRLAAHPLAPCIELDQLNQAALLNWQTVLESALDCQLVMNSELLSYRLNDRRLLNPGSPYPGLFWLRLEALHDADPAQLPQPGDLIDIHLNNGERRTYSLANAPLPEKHRYIELIVRQHYRHDGTPGDASHYLSERIDGASQINVSLRRGFDWSQIPAASPLLLIGAGSGLAGIRAGLQARQGNRQGPNWLIFGERDPHYDRPCEAELSRYLQLGALRRLDRVWSQPTTAEPLRYVQDVLHRNREQLAAYLMQGAYIYLCGSASGLGAGVHDALVQLIGEPLVTALCEQGRYIRDIY